MSEHDFKKLYDKLPDPGPAFTAARVMDKIHEGETLPSVKPRHIVWGMASSLTGLILGIWLSSATMTDSSATVYPLLGGVDPLVEMEDGLDRIIFDLTTDYSEES